MPRSALCTLGLCAGLLAACGGEEPPANDTPAPTVGDLESQGQLPTLDRSAGLAGPDAGGNGIRDDIDAWIAGRQATPELRAALAQLARAYQASVVRGSQDAAAALDAAAQSGQAISCIMTHSASEAEGMQAMSVLRKMTANTRERVQAYLAYARALDGAVMAVSDKDGCDAQ
ncbi:hypothetical protein PIGHUM_00817 [Pigmentiphaga humi]|uniref:Lipoprotein n=1 Tax=Pigmentiphaga humi TaxID=2478468 RepID=A0A3P4AXG8_9BURK|nr:hypothetical protein [Pigmentiphaga humi]VCU68759.1 hypothetical protein PIGHUM_00817 [Pigmentiphaga humi]